MTNTIHINDLSECCQGGERLQLIDVRSSAEFAAGHLPGASNIPMDQIEMRLADLDPSEPVILVCQSGKRASMTAALLQPHGMTTRVLSGGTAAWKAAGHPVVGNRTARWSLERQVRLGAGLLVLASLLLAWTLHPNWLFLTAFVGAGLSFAGLTDICLMGSLLGRMPWNHARRVTSPPIPQAAPKEAS